jgi:thioesterase domain-containing protein
LLANHPSPDVTFGDGESDLLVPLRGGGGRPPLFCVHAVSGSAYAYSELTGLLDADQPVYGFEAPGFDNDHAPVSSLPQLADEYTAIIRAVAPGQDIRLLGWSLGGTVAFEIAKRLRAAGETVSAIILVDAPVPRPYPLPAERDILLRFINDMQGTSEDEAQPEVRALSDTWPEDVDPATVFPAVEAAEILPGEMDATMLADQYAVFRALLEGFNSIEITGSFDGDAVHIIAEISPRPEMDWSGHMPAVSEIILPGTHYSIWSGESLIKISEIVRSTLNAH